MAGASPGQGWEPPQAARSALDRVGWPLAWREREDATTRGAAAPPERRPERWGAGPVPAHDASSATGMTRVAPPTPPCGRTAGSTEAAGTRRDAHHPRAAGRGARRGPVERRGAGPRSAGGGRLARSPARQGARPRILPRRFVPCQDHWSTRADRTSGGLFIVAHIVSEGAHTADRD